MAMNIYIRFTDPCLGSSFTILAVEFCFFFFLNFDFIFYFF